jgi:hypothetical protein
MDTVSLYDFNPPGKYWGWKVWNPIVNDWEDMPFLEQLKSQINHYTRIFVECNKYFNLVFLTLVAAKLRIKYNVHYSVIDFWHNESNPEIEEIE